MQVSRVFLVKRLRIVFPRIPIILSGDIVTALFSPPFMSLISTACLLADPHPSFRGATPPKSPACRQSFSRALLVDGGHS